MIGEQVADFVKDKSNLFIMIMGVHVQPEEP